jgi:hypothetical protein
MNEREKEKLLSIFKNDIKNFIYESLEYMEDVSVPNDLFFNGYDAAMEALLNYLDDYQEEKEDCRVGRTLS